MNMSNRGYLSAPHRLLPGYAGLSASRSSLGVGAPPSSRASPPEFSYDAYPRSGSGGGVRDSSSFTRTPTSAATAANTALGLAYQNMSEFPYGLSGVQMPTYNFGSELYNYVSNGFPRKSRMCTFCNKVFTRSTTRRYHERRCPLLRASNSLAKSEENNSAAAVAAVAAMKDQQQQRQKESALSPSAVAPRSHSSSNHNSSIVQSGPTPSSNSPPTPSLHPAYPTSFPPTSALAPSPSRNASAYGNYTNPYNAAHYYGHTLSTAALAALDQNSNSLQFKKESDNASWASSSPSPSSKQRDTPSSVLANTSSLLKAFNPDPSLDMTARYCADFSIRSQPPVFPPTSLRGPPTSPPSPEPGETKSDSTTHGDSSSPNDLTRTSTNNADQPSSGNNNSPPCDGQGIQGKIAVANVSGARLKTSSPPPVLWNNKMRMERAREQYMSVQPVDDDEEEDDEEEEDEGAVEEDEEQFNALDVSLNQTSEMEDEGFSGKKGPNSPLQKNTTYNPLVCQYCKESFSDITTRKAHEELHAQRKAFACSVCSHSFHCAYGLRIHFLRHHKEGPYKCKYCLETHKEPLNLKAHLVNHHNLPKAEQHSLKYFSFVDSSYDKIPPLLMTSGLSDGEQDSKKRSNLGQRHSADNVTEAIGDDDTTKMRTTNETSIEPVPNGSIANEETEVCKICNKAFLKSFIRIHERSHADQKPYECPMCHKRFGYKNNMKSHMKLHQGLKPYQCQICGARFTRGSTLRRHGRRHNISRNSMLDYVLYDHSAGPTRAVGVHSKPSLSTTTQTAAAVAAAAAIASTPYSHHARMTSAEHGISKSLSYLQHTRAPLMPNATGSDRDRHNSTNGRSPVGSPPPRNAASPRTPSNHLTSQSMGNPMVGDLAAVVAPHLFGYQAAAAAPHLYQFYASTNPLMNYPAYVSNQNSSAVQSDALNLSLGKRKSSIEEEGEIKNKLSKKENNILSKEKENFHRRSLEVRENHIGVKSEEPGELVKFKNDVHNPFMPNFAIKKEFSPRDASNNNTDRNAHREPLKLTTEDFGAQVNICCPSPMVQSSTTSCQHPQPVSSGPVGSSTCPEPLTHQRAHASPSGLSHRGSPVNSATSVTSPNAGILEPREGQTVPDLLHPLLKSGRMFRCSFCDIYFTEYAMFRVHQKHHQIDSARPFVCSYCGEDCKEKNFFTLHISAHLKLVTT
ncbi:zinc finger protein 236-like [Aplysia californica]|uniref:Zinc finger protein 236-like n=1 Tax=Aplysia californica TaxID=6500 RepID=A0ABM0K622_APLCA|nr:zinc finger protein 236-like [Aplysia californica]